MGFSVGALAGYPLVTISSVVFQPHFISYL